MGNIDNSLGGDASCDDDNSKTTLFWRCADPMICLLPAPSAPVIAPPTNHSPAICLWAGAKQTRRLGRLQLEVLADADP